MTEHVRVDEPNCHRLRALQEVSRFPAQLLTALVLDDLAGQVRDRLAVDSWGIS